MTVRCITESQKDVLIQLWRDHGCITELALVFHRSPRTIQRVLEERGFGSVRLRKATPAPLALQPAKPIAPIPKSAQIPLFSTFPHPLTVGGSTPVNRGLRA